MLPGVRLRNLIENQVVQQWNILEYHDIKPAAPHTSSPHHHDPPHLGCSLHSLRILSAMVAGRFKTVLPHSLAAGYHKQA